MAIRCRWAVMSLVVGALAVPCATAQQPLNAEDSTRLTQLLDSPPPAASLRCSIRPLNPWFDFAFRIDEMYQVSCPLVQVGGRQTELLILARVTPEGGKPYFLGQSYRLPETRRERQRQNILVSGGFAVGEGEYQVELLVGDRDLGRQSRKNWHVTARRRGSQQATAMGLPPGTVSPIGVRPAPIKMEPHGLRVTILLDAAPLNPRTPTLRAWDRAFLLGSLYSLLRQVPCASVRLRAFNLDQQREFFHQEPFDDAGFVKLVSALEKLELGSVSYQILQHPNGWADMLLSYARAELTAGEPSDIVIFLGPRTRYISGIVRSEVPLRETRSPRFYYLEYFPFQRNSHLPDALATLTKRLDGNVYEIASPGDLARSVQKILARSQPPAR